MSEKKSINVEVLGINATHNFIVPGDMNVLKVISLILKILESEYPQIGNVTMEKHFLIREDTGKALLENCSLDDSGVVNGERLILI